LHHTTTTYVKTAAPVPEIMDIHSYALFFTSGTLITVIAKKLKTTIVAQLVNKFPVFGGNEVYFCLPKYLYRVLVHKDLLLVSVLSKINPLLSPSFCIVRTCFNIILLP
jgi:hypothetical protein